MYHTSLENSRFLLSFQKHMKCHFCSGNKFGCDYLLYSVDEHGDTSNHAKYCAHIIDDIGNKELSMLDLVSMCRLSDSVKKTALLIPCTYWDQISKNRHGYVEIELQRCVQLSRGE